MTTTVSVSIDVPSLAQGLAFYGGAFGFTEKSRPVPGVAVLHGLNVELCLLEKLPGSAPSPNTTDRRRYERHWSPVHLDFHVEDLQAALRWVEALGASASKYSRIPSKARLRSAAIRSAMVSAFSSSAPSHEAAA